METVYVMLKNGNLIKTLSAVFLFMLAMMCLAMAGYNMFLERPIPDLVKMFLGVAIGYAGKVWGFEIGAQTALTNPSMPAVRKD